jgi:ELWxxDGT repeat protein
LERYLADIDAGEFGTISLVADINPNNGDSDPGEFKVFNDKLYFSAFDGIERELWVYDGSSTPEKVADINPGGSSFPSDLTVFNNKLYFSATDSSAGRELWVYDGAFTIARVEDINDTGDSLRLLEGFLTVFKNKLYFSATDGSSGNKELWVFDGNTPPEIAADINPTGSSFPYELIVFNDKLYFNARGPVDDFELWVYDGSSPPELVANINLSSDSIPQNFAVFNDKLYFQATDGINGNELWVYDGIFAPTGVANINPDDGDSNPRDLTVFNNKLYFSADDGTSGRELWVYDGSASPPEMVADINMGSGGSFPTHLTVFDGKLYFSVFLDGSDGELWVYDGTSPPAKVAEISPTGLFLPKNFVVFNDKLYFNANDGTNGFELWVLDPTVTPGPTPAPTPIPSCSCFSLLNTVQVKDKGLVAMGDIKVGDQVQVGNGNFARVYTLAHINENQEAEFLQIHVEGMDEPFEITPNHLLFVYEGKGRGTKEVLPASMVQVGSQLVAASGRAVRIIGITRVRRKGIFAPFTTTGEMVVGGVVVSTYALFYDTDEVGFPISFQQMAHAAMAPLRIACSLNFKWCENETHSVEGISTWVPEGFCRWFSKQLPVVQAIIVSLLVPPLSAIYGLEILLSWNDVLAGVLLGVVSIFFWGYYAKTKTSRLYT